MSCCGMTRAGRLVTEVYEDYSAALQHCEVCVWTREHLPEFFPLAICII